MSGLEAIRWKQTFPDEVSAIVGIDMATPISFSCWTEEQVKKTVTPALVLADGNRATDFGVPCRCVVKGDGISQSIAAASVLAKVTRDRQLAELDRLYPAYGFAKHKGYPTKEHKLAVFEYGPSPVHRKSFLSFLTRDAAQLEAALAEKKADEASPAETPDVPGDAG